jgi:putative hydrolase of the HAD superfamily
MNLVATRQGQHPIWFFDLDDTLHLAHRAMFGVIDRHMTDYLVEHLQVGRSQADLLRRQYWQRYGATLLGLIRHHNIRPDHFLAETHRFDVVPHLHIEPGLQRRLQTLAGRKILLTNSPTDYANRVLHAMNLDGFFDHCCAIESMQIHGQLRPKPSRALFRVLRHQHRLGAPRRGPRPILVDDNLDNLKAAHAEGYVTILVATRGSASHGQRGVPRRLPGSGYITLRLRSAKMLVTRRNQLHHLGCH